MIFICTDCGCEVKQPPKGQPGLITCGCRKAIRREGRTHAARA